MAVLAHSCLAALVFESQQEQSTQIQSRAEDRFSAVESIFYIADCTITVR